MKNLFLRFIGKVNNEKGIALATALMVLTVFSILGVSLMAITINNAKLSTIDKNSNGAYYVAMAGANYKLQEISAAIKSETSNDIHTLIHRLSSKGAFETIDSNTSDKLNFHLENTHALVQVNNEMTDSKTAKFKITSKGTFENQTSTVEVIFNIHSENGSFDFDIPNYAISSPGNIILRGGFTINGDISVNEDLIDKTNGVTINGQINSLSHNLEPFPLPEFPNYPIPENKKIEKDRYNSYDVILNGDLRIDSWISNGFTLNLHENVAFNEIKLTSNNTLNINIGNKNRSIVVKNLNVKNGHINIIGSGNLNIYVNEEIEMGAGSTINNNGSIDKLTIYFKGGANPDKPKKFKLNGAQKINGSLIAGNVDIEINGGAGFKGNIITAGKNVKINGGAWANPTLFYAPNADFEISGGASITGVIVAKNLIGSGGAVIKYEKIENLPTLIDGSDNVQNSYETNTEPIRLIN